MPDGPSTSAQLLTSGESQIIEAFAQKYGEGHVLLACHAAFPMVLTADLVYKIWQNFRNYTDENGNLQEIPYIAVSDFLLSPLCRSSGYQRFEMPPNLRQALLEALQNDPDFGKPRLQELAAFLKHYIESAYLDADAIGQAIRNAQQLMVDAWLDPEKALQTLTQAFMKSENAPAEQVRLSNLMQGFSIQWSSGLMAEGLEMPGQAQTVLRYSQGLSAFHKTGNAGHAADILKGIIRKGNSGLVLPLPGAVKTSVSRRLSQPPKGKLFALLIALDEYHPRTKIPALRGCKNDARELANWVEDMHKTENSPWSEIRVEMLFDEQATFSILEKRAEMLREIGPEDQVLIFFAGHARVDGPEDETDLIYYDSLLPGSQKLTVSRFRNLVQTNARQQPYITVVLDAEFTGYPNWLDPTNPKHVVFANTGLRENGYEVSGSGGFFTKYFIDALVQNGGRASNAALFLDTISGMSEDELSAKQHPQFYATPLGAERPFLQTMDAARTLKRLLRLSGASLAEMQNRLKLPEHASKQQWQSGLTTFLAEKEQTDVPLFLFVFSDADGDLPGVQQEMNQMRSLIEAPLQNTRIEAVVLHNPVFQELQRYFTAPEYRNRLYWFHFSGLDKENTPIFQSTSKMAMKKANPIQQQLNTGSLSNIGDEPEGPARSGFLLADGLLTFFEFAPWLVYQQNLRMAFINSCFSNHNAAWATQLGVWNAIGVEGNVSDSAATRFALDFYSKWMVKGNALSAAFQDVLEVFQNNAGPDAGSTTHRSARPFEEESAPSADVPFQLKSASWLTTGWRGERFSDYNLIADPGLRALVFEYDSLDVSDKKERVSKKMKLAGKIGEVINSVVADKSTLLGPQASQGLLAGLVNAVRQHPGELDAALLLELAPMVEQLFVRYAWVEAVEEMRKQGVWPEARNGELEGVLKGFEEGADEELRERIVKAIAFGYYDSLLRLVAKGEIEKSISILNEVGKVIFSNELIKQSFSVLATYNLYKKSFNSGLTEIEEYFRQRLSSINEILGLVESFLPDMLTVHISGKLIPSANKDDLTTMLASGEIELCIETLLRQPEIDKKQLLLISARKELLNKDYNVYGLIDSTTYNRFNNAVTKALLEFIEEEYQQLNSRKFK